MIDQNAPFKAVPRITRADFATIIQRDANPALAQERDGGEYWDAAVAYGVDPLFLLAMFNHESTLGKAGTAQTTHSWGNTRDPSFGATPTGETVGRSGTFPIFATWLDGCKSTAARLVEPTWVYAKRPRIIDIFDWPASPDDVWAPAGDLNDPAGYVRAVLDYMNAHADPQQTGGASVGTVPQPAWTVVPNITNKGGYSGKRLVLGAVNHIMVGTIQGTISWFQNPASGASSNFGIAKNGDLYLFVHPDEPAWANGPIKAPDMSSPLVKAIVASGLNPNMLVVSKEFEGEQGDVFTDAQIATSNRLDAWLSQRYGYAMTRNWNIGHYQLDSVTRPNCPGQSDAVWQRLISGAQALRGGTDVPATYATYFPETQHSVGGGFRTFWTANGGLPIFGYPLTDEIQEAGTTVQYFERAVFEFHPENAAPFDILLRRLGAAALDAKLAAQPPTPAAT